jgi:hypothetical protein
MHISCNPEAACNLLHSGLNTKPECASVERLNYQVLDNGQATTE